MILLIITLSAWAIVHSIMATLWFKDIVRKFVGDRTYDGLYRLFYNGFSAITFLPVLYFAAVLLPDGKLWTIHLPLNLLFFAVQIGAAICLLISLLRTDLPRFAGLGQAARYFSGAADINPSPKLVTDGFYGFVRHPLYLFGLLIIWFSPVMTWSLLVFNLCATLYFWIGSVYEERRLAVIFGDEYGQYQKDVPRLFPTKINWRR